MKKGLLVLNNIKSILSCKLTERFLIGLKYMHVLTIDLHHYLWIQNSVSLPTKYGRKRSIIRRFGQQTGNIYNPTVISSWNLKDQAALIFVLISSCKYINL